MQFWVLVLTVLFGIHFQLPAYAQQFGSFSNAPIVKFGPQGRIVELMEQLDFTDDKSRIWSVPAGTKVDGASIPKFLWQVVGPPFVGKYRDASIIHDHFCERRAHDWREVHRLFYLGMRARGVGKHRAWFMYKAVERFGPRWEASIEIPPSCEAGPQFDPESCVLNADPEIVDKTIPFNRSNFDEFAREFEGQDYGTEIATIRELLD